MMLRQSGSRHATLMMDMQNDYTKRIKDTFPANHQELQRKFESLSFSKHVGSQSSHGTTFFQQQQTKKDLMLTHLLMTGNNGLTEFAPTVASKAILIFTLTKRSELILQLLQVSTLPPTLLFQLQSPLSLL
jgi:hypothetical protein